MDREQILTGDCRAILPTLEPESVQCCVTSPPYWGLRDYGVDGALGLESTPEEYLARMVTVFRELWRVLRDDGTLWVNMGDSYAQACGQMRGEHETKEKAIARLSKRGGPRTHHGGWEVTASRSANTAVSGLKPKDLCMMPARLAMALQADGWYLRSDIIWHKPNPMPESVTDRPTKSHEYIFLLTKNGGNPLIWKARDTGEWSYKPDLSEKLLGSKKLLEGGGLSGWDSGPDAHTKLVGRYEY